MNEGTDRKKEIQENCLCIQFLAYQLVRLDTYGLGWKVWSEKRRQWRGAQQYAQRLDGALKLMLTWADKGAVLEIGDEVSGKAGEKMKTDEQCKMPLTPQEIEQVRIMAQWAEYFHALIECGVAPQFMGKEPVLDYGGYVVKRHDKHNLKSTGILYAKDSGYYGNWNHAAHDLLEKIMTGPHKTLNEAQIAGFQFLQYAATFFNFDLGRDQDADGRPLKVPPPLPILGSPEE